MFTGRHNITATDILCLPVVVTSQPHTLYYVYGSSQHRSHTHYTMFTGRCNITATHTVLCLPVVTTSQPHTLCYVYGSSQHRSHRYTMCTDVVVTSQSQIHYNFNLPVVTTITATDTLYLPVVTTITATDTLCLLVVVTSQPHTLYYVYWSSQHRSHRYTIYQSLQHHSHTHYTMFTGRHNITATDTLCLPVVTTITATDTLCLQYRSHTHYTMFTGRCNIEATPTRVFNN